MTEARRTSTDSIVGHVLACRNIERFEGIDAEEFSLASWTAKAVEEFYAAAFASGKTVILVDDEGVHWPVKDAGELGMKATRRHGISAVYAMPGEEWAMIQEQLPRSLMRT